MPLASLYIPIHRASLANWFRCEMNVKSRERIIRRKNLTSRRSKAACYGKISGLAVTKTGDVQVIRTLISVNALAAFSSGARYVQIASVLHSFYIKLLSIFCINFMISRFTKSTKNKSWMLTCVSLADEIVTIVAEAFCVNPSLTSRRLHHSAFFYQWYLTRITSFPVGKLLQ